MITQISKIKAVLRDAHWSSCALICLGLIAPLGFIINVKVLKGLGLAWMISPLPIVFSDSNGYEAFAAKFNIHLKFSDGTQLDQDISYHQVSELSGPYNRRNIYGAAIGYAPRLPLPMVESVLKYGFCRNQILLTELGIDKSVLSATLQIQDRTTGREDKKYEYEVKCNL